MAVAISIVTATSIGCIEADFALDATPQVAVDPQFIGGWRCITPQKSGDASTVTIKQAGPRDYSMIIQGDDEEPETWEATLSSVSGTVFANVKKADSKRWNYLRVAMVRPNILHAQIVQDDLFKSTAKTAAAVRETIEKTLNDPKLTDDGVVCMRIKER